MLRWALLINEDLSTDRMKCNSISCGIGTTHQHTRHQRSTEMLHTQVYGGVGWAQAEEKERKSVGKKQKNEASKKKAIFCTICGGIKRNLTNSWWRNFFVVVRRTTEKNYRFSIRLPLDLWDEFRLESQNVSHKIVGRSQTWPRVRVWRAHRKLTGSNAMRRLSTALSLPY